jgi:prolyl-tRNA synthetase
MGVPLDAAARHIDTLLRDIQKGLYERAKAFREANTVKVDTYEEFKALFPAEKDEDSGEEAPSASAGPLKFVLAHWDGTRETEDRIQRETKATIRVIPFDRPQEKGKCMVSGKPSEGRVVFARAY